MKTDTIIIEDFIGKHGPEAARALDKLEPDKLALFFNDSSIELLSELVPHMNPYFMSGVFELMHQNKVTQLIESLDIQYVLLSIRLMNTGFAEGMLSRISSEKSDTIKLSVSCFAVWSMTV